MQREGRTLLGHSTVGNGNLFGGLASRRCAAGLNGLDHFSAGDDLKAKSSKRGREPFGEGRGWYLAEDAVLAVEVGSRDGGDEELAAVGVGA